MQRKLVVDTESGSIRLHRPHLFDPPLEKMKGIEGEEKSNTGKNRDLRTVHLTGGFGEKVGKEWR